MTDVAVAPDQKRRYAILGTGAIGGYYGACLQRAGFEVHFLLHRDYAQVKASGLTVRSVAGDFSLPQVHAHQSVATIPPCDGVAIALKTTQNHLLTTLLPPLIHPQTTVLTLQNGFGVEAAIAPLLPPATPLLGGLCFICAQKTGPGQIAHLDYGSLLLAAYSPDEAPQGITPALATLAADWQAAGIDITTSPHLLEARWRKLVWNVPFNGLSVVLNALTDAMMGDRHSRDLAKHLMDEVLAIAQAQGVTIPADFREKMLKDTAAMKPYRTSMKLDYESGRPLEVEAIFGNPLRLAQHLGVPCPYLAMLYAQLKFLDAQRT